MSRKLLGSFFAGSGVLICAFLVHSQTKTTGYGGPAFEDVTRKSGLTVPHQSSPDKRYVIESMSGGVGLFDCDNDGKLDVVTVNGSTVDRYREGGDPLVTLYRQEPDGTFKDITTAAGLTKRGWGMGVAVADFDNDGLLDLYVTGYGGNVLYRNLGNCKFEDVTEKAGVAQVQRGLTTTATAMWICSSHATCTSTLTTCPNSAATNFADTKVCWFNVVPGDSKARVISCITTVATAHLRKSPSAQAFTIRKADSG